MVWIAIQLSPELVCRLFCRSPACSETAEGLVRQELPRWTIMNRSCLTRSARLVEQVEGNNARDEGTGSVAAALSPPASFGPTQASPSRLVALDISAADRSRASCFARRSLLGAAGRVKRSLPGAVSKST
jgi:hypothetical protein